MDVIDAAAGGGSRTPLLFPECTVKLSDIFN
jgi:hypothetical protein